MNFVIPQSRLDNFERDHITIGAQVDAQVGAQVGGPAITITVSNPFAEGPDHESVRRHLELLTQNHLDMLVEYIRTATTLTKHKSMFDIYMMFWFIETYNVRINASQNKLFLLHTKTEYYDKTDIHYIRAVSRITNGEFIMFEKFIQQHPDPFSAMRNMKDAVYYVGKSDILIEDLLMFKRYSVVSAFNNNDRGIKRSIDRLMSSQKSESHRLVLNPFDPLFSDYFNYSVPDIELWSCDTVTNIKRPAVGECVLTPYEQALKKLETFTCGLVPLIAKLKPRKIEPVHTDNFADNEGNESDHDDVQSEGGDDVQGEPVNPDEFPWDNVVIAGGGPQKVLDNRIPVKSLYQADVDFFVFGKDNDERRNVLERLLKWFTKGRKPTDVFFAIRGSVVSVYIKGIWRKFQIVSARNFVAEDVIMNFDTTHIQWYYHAGTFFGTPDAFEALRTLTAKFNNVGRIKTTRLVKSLYWGYDIEKNLEVTEDLTLLLTKDDKGQINKQLAEMKEGFMTFYYPQDNPNMEPAENDAHHVGMIRKDADPTWVTQDPRFVLKNTIVGGTFDSNYLSLAYNTAFNVLAIDAKPIGRGKDGVVRSRHGPIKLNSPVLTVVKVEERDNQAGGDLVIIFKIFENEFVRFLQYLETDVWRLYNRNDNVQQKIVLNDDIFEVVLSNRAILDKANRQSSFLKSSNGAILPINEDLSTGNQVQMLFKIHIWNNDVKRVTLDPVVMFKIEQATGSDELVALEIVQDEACLTAEEILENSDEAPEAVQEILYDD